VSTVLSLPLLELLNPELLLLTLLLLTLLLLELVDSEQELPEHDGSHQIGSHLPGVPPFTTSNCRSPHVEWDIAVSILSESLTPTV